MEISARNARQLGNALKRHKCRCGLTQTELGAQSGRHQTTISDIERGLPGVRETFYDVMAVLNLEIVLRERSSGEGGGARGKPDLGSIF